MRRCGGRVRRFRCDPHDGRPSMLQPFRLGACAPHHRGYRRPGDLFFFVVDDPVAVVCVTHLLDECVI